MSHNKKKYKGAAAVSWRKHGHYRRGRTPYTEILFWERVRKEGLENIKMGTVESVTIQRGCPKPPQQLPPTARFTKPSMPARPRTMHMHGGFKRGQLVMMVAQGDGSHVAQ